MKLNLSYPNKQERAEKVRELNALFAAKHMLQVSPLKADIAEAIGVGVEKLDRLTEKRRVGRCCGVLDGWSDKRRKA